MKKLIKYILGSTCLGIMVISVTISDFNILVRNILGVLLGQFARFFGWEQIRPMETMVSIVMPLSILIIIYQRGYDGHIYAAIGSWLNLFFD